MIKQFMEMIPSEVVNLISSIVEYAVRNMLLEENVVQSAILLISLLALNRFFKPVVNIRKKYDFVEIINIIVNTICLTGVYAFAGAALHHLAGLEVFVDRYYFIIFYAAIPILNILSNLLIVFTRDFLLPCRKRMMERLRCILSKCRL